MTCITGHGMLISSYCRTARDTLVVHVLMYNDHKWALKIFIPSVTVYSAYSSRDGSTRHRRRMSWQVCSRPRTWSGTTVLGADVGRIDSGADRPVPLI